MSQFVHLLTAVAIFVHATMGCCTHADNEVGNDCCEHAECPAGEHHDHSMHAETDAEHCLASSGDVDSHSADDHSSHQPSPHECQHSKCSWSVPNVRNQVDVELNNLMTQLYPITVVLASLHIDQARSIYASTPELFRPALPVRQHLANCVFLI